MTTTGGSGGAQTDVTGLSFTDGAGTTSTYHLYAGGLDWTKAVGILIYTDGSGEFGLANPGDAYLMAGPTGMIATAKKHNMILLTPRAPGNGCTDGDGVCWYLDSLDGMTIARKIAWSRALVNYIYGRYNIERTRVCFGGYSSGAQWTTQYFGPAHAAQLVEDGVAVAIGYGGEPLVTVNHPAAYKAAVPYVWDTGATDPAYTDTTSIYAIPKGKAWYDNAGFTTQLHTVPGVGHARDGAFGGVIDREITEHVMSADMPSGGIGTPRIGGLVGGALVGDGSTSATTAVPYPSGVVAGEFLVIAISARATSALPAFTAAGWTAVVSQNTDAASPTRFVFLYKIAAAGDVGATTVAVSGAAVLRSLKMMAVPGVDPAAPISGTPTLYQSGAPSVTDVTMPSQTPAVAGCMPVWGASGFQGSGVTWSSAQAGAVEWLDTWQEVATGNYRSGAAYYQPPLGSTAATGTRTATNSMAASAAGAFLLLRPAPDTVPTVAAGLGGSGTLTAGAALPPAAAVPPAFGSVSSLAYNARSNSAVNVPAGVTAGSTVLLFLYQDETIVTVSPPSGFAEIPFNPVAQGNSPQKVQVFWKRATGADSGTYAFTHATTSTEAAAIRYTAVTAENPPYQLLQTAIDNTDGTSGPSLSGTTSDPGSLLIHWLSNFQTADFTAPTGFVERFDGSDMGISDKAQSAAGATGTITGTASAAGRRTAGLFALLPASVSAPAALSGSGTLAAEASPNVTRDAALSSAGTLTAVPRLEVVRDVELSSSGSLTATPRILATDTAPLGGSGTLTVATTARPIQTAVLTGSGTLVALTNPAAFKGTGTLTAVTAFTAAQAAALSGAGALTAIVVAAGSLSGSGALTAGTLAKITRVAALSSTGNLNARAVAAQLTGAGTLTATVTFQFAALNGPVVGKFVSDGVFLGVFTSHVGAA